MRRIILLALLTAAAIFLLPTNAQAAGIPCLGPPADYVAAFDAKDGVVDGKVSYTEDRMYMEVQGWLTRIGETPGHHSEHIHSGTCFPQGATWANVASSRLDYKHIFHNVVGYNLASIRGGFVDAGGNGPAATGNTTANKQALNQAMDASGGDKTTVVFQSYPIPLSQMTCSGRVEFRTGLDLRGVNVGQPGGGLVVRWFTSTGWQSNLPGSKKTCTSGRGNDVTIYRNWASGFDYGNVGMGIHRAGTANDPKPEPWTVNTDFASGVNRGSLHANPDFHSHPDNPGIFSKALTFDGQKVTIPTDTFSPGVYREVMLGHEGGGAKITSTVVGVIPFRVA